jgi:hypothetical protein
MELEEINRRFNEELQMQMEGTLPKGHIYKLGYPDEKLIAARVPYLPIELSAQRLAVKASESYGHPFSIANLLNLPKAINEPIMIFNSAKGDGSKVILLDLQCKGSNYVAIVRVQYKGSGRGNPQINDIRSIYPKDNVSGVFD